jgi:hypothetical protein
VSTLISSDIELQVGGDRLSVTGTDSALVARAESIWALLRIRKGLPRTPQDVDWKRFESMFGGLRVSCVVGRREVASMRLESTGLLIRTRWLSAFISMFSRGR